MKSNLAVTTALRHHAGRGKGHFNPHGCQAKEIVFKARPGHNTLVGLIGGIPKKSKRPWRQRILAKHGGGHAEAIVEQKHAWGFANAFLSSGSGQHPLQIYAITTCVHVVLQVGPNVNHINPMWEGNHPESFYFHSHSSLGPMKFQLNLWGGAS